MCRALPLPRFVGGAVGYLSYEAVRAFEPRVGLAAGSGLGSPDARYMLVDSLLVFDHVERTIKVVSHLHLDDAPGSLRRPTGPRQRGSIELVVQLRTRHAGTSDRRRAGRRPVSRIDRRVNTDRPGLPIAWSSTAKEYIAAGDIFQVVLSQRVDIRHRPTRSRSTGRCGRSTHRPYMFYLDFGDHSDRRRIAGAAGAGRGRRGRPTTRSPAPGRAVRTPRRTTALAEELLADEKERAEHIMLVDLGRNDVGRVAKPGTVRVPRLMEIERYSHVMHIVSNVDRRAARRIQRRSTRCGPASRPAPSRRAEDPGDGDHRRAGDRPPRRLRRRGRLSRVSTATWTPASRSGRWSARTASPRCRRAAASSPTARRTVEYAECFHKMRALVRAIELAESIERQRRRDAA